MIFEAPERLWDRASCSKH